MLINLSVLFNKPTGIATYAQNVVKSLQGLNPTLLSNQEFNDFICHPIPPNMTPEQGNKGHFKRLLWTQFQLPQIFKQLKASLVYSPIPEAPLYSPCRYVVMCHDLIPLRFPHSTSPLTNYFRHVVPLILQQAEHIICNSQATANDIINFYGISGGKISPILLGYDRANFYPRVTPNSSVEQPYFLYLGRHDVYKNLAGLITAFAAVPSSDYRLAIAGSVNPRFTPMLRQQATELGIAKRIIWLDYLSYQELPLVISGATALVFPTLWEGFGLPALEAMACGTPVITSNLASLPEITGDAAILIDPYDSGEITSAMANIAADPEMRSQLSMASIKQAQNFSWEKTGKATKQVLEQFI